MDKSQRHLPVKASSQLGDRSRLVPESTFSVSAVSHIKFKPRLWPCSQTGYRSASNGNPELPAHLDRDPRLACTAARNVAHSRRPLPLSMQI